MVTVSRRVALLSCVMGAVPIAGCDHHMCPVMEVRHETVDVSWSLQNSYFFSLCVDSGDCQHLCVDAARERSPYRSAVDACRLVDARPGIDAGTVGDLPQVSLEITYRVFEACGS